MGLTSQARRQRITTSKLSAGLIRSPETAPRELPVREDGLIRDTDRPEKDRTLKYAFSFLLSAYMHEALRILDRTHNNVLIRSRSSSFSSFVGVLSSDHSTCVTCLPFVYDECLGLRDLHAVNQRLIEIKEDRLPRLILKSREEHGLRSIEPRY